MPFAKVETSVPRNPKFIKAGPAACWLWVCGNCYCQEYLTDGFIPDEVVHFVCQTGSKTRTKRIISVLIRAGLWHRVEGGYKVHGYLEYNHSAEEIRAIRKKRRVAGAQGGRPSHKANRKQIGKQVGTAVQNPMVVRTDLKAVQQAEVPTTEVRTSENEVLVRTTECRELENSSPPPSADEVLLEYPTRGPKQTWWLTVAHFARLDDLFGHAMDVEFECRNALEYVLSNPANKKTARGMPAFLARWMRRVLARHPVAPPKPPYACKHTNPHCADDVAHTQRCNAERRLLLEVAHGTAH